MAKSQAKIKQQKRIKNIPMLNSSQMTFMRNGVSEESHKTKMSEYKKRRVQKESRKINRVK
jgi:hypothetical protein